MPPFVRHHNHTTLHLEIMMPMPLTVSCFSKIQIGFTFLVPAHPGSPGQSAVKRVCVCVWCAEGVASSFLNVAWCRCGVPGIWTNVGTGGPPRITRQLVPWSGWLVTWQLHGVDVVLSFVTRRCAHWPSCSRNPTAATSRTSAPSSRTSSQVRRCLQPGYIRHEVGSTMPRLTVAIRVAR